MNMFRLVSAYSSPASKSSFLVAFAAAVFCLYVGQVKANVYPTNVRVNGGTVNLSVTNASGITITYLLNEPASGGATVAIKSGAATVRTISLTNGAAGTLRGTNSVVWDGKDDLGQSVSEATYTISITAASTGYTNWTQISDDNTNFVWQGRGIAVNQNLSSPYYGRVYVANSSEGSNPGTTPGDRLGVLKFNPDGSPAEEGLFSGGGYPWTGGFYSPLKVEVAADDRVYVNDYTLHGLVVSFDQLISSNSVRYVLRTDNYPTNGNLNLDGPFVSGSGTNMQVWMADATPGGFGIRRWDMNANGIIATNDIGTTVVRSGSGSDLGVFPEDIAVDKSNRIYTIQNISAPGSPAYRLLRFPPDSGTPETLADWKVGNGDDTMSGAYGVAVDPTGAYVAVALIGMFTADWQYGGVSVLNTTNGASVTTLAPGVAPSHYHFDVAWDNAGNLYAVDDWDSVWRVYSPPGTNQATTLALATVTVGGSSPSRPILSTPTYSNGQFTFTLTGDPNTTYIIQYSTNFTDWISIATNNAPTATRQITVPAPVTGGFFRVVLAPPSSPGPVLTAPAYAAGQFQFTLLGEPNVTYVILSSSNLLTWIPVATNTSASATRQITITAPANEGFFRAVVGAQFPTGSILTAAAYFAGQFQFTLLGEPNVTYVILSSSNLQSWIPVATNTSASATRQIIINAPAGQGFFRAQSQ